MPRVQASIAPENQFKKGEREMTNLQDDLKQFYGSGVLYRHPMNKNIVYTEGVQYLAEKGKAYWLIDDICFAYQTIDAIRNISFQTWVLKKNAEGEGATLRVEDGNKNLIKSFDIAFTDFPLPGITLWLIEGTLLLPSEY